MGGPNTRPVVNAEGFTEEEMRLPPRQRFEAVLRRQQVVSRGAPVAEVLSPDFFMPPGQVSGGPVPQGPAARPRFDSSQPFRVADNWNAGDSFRQRQAAWDAAHPPQQVPAPQQPGGFAGMVQDAYANVPAQGPSGTPAGANPGGPPMANLDDFDSPLARRADVAAAPDTARFYRTPSPAPTATDAPPDTSQFYHEGAPATPLPPSVADFNRAPGGGTVPQAAPRPTPRRNWVARDGVGPDLSAQGGFGGRTTLRSGETVEGVGSDPRAVNRSQRPGDRLPADMPQQPDLTGGVADAAFNPGQTAEMLNGVAVGSDMASDGTPVFTANVPGHNSPFVAPMTPGGIDGTAREMAAVGIDPAIVDSIVSQWERMIPLHGGPAAGPQQPRNVVETSVSQDLTLPIDPAIAAEREALEGKYRELARAQQMDQYRQGQANVQGRQLLDTLADEQLAQRQQQEQARQMESRRRVANLDAAIRDLSRRDIQPDRFFAGNGGANRFGAALAVALGSLGSSLTGGPNEALAIINATVERDIEAQRANMANAQAGVGAQQSALGMFLNMLGDERAAEEATRAAAYGNLVQRINTQIQSYGPGMAVRGQQLQQALIDLQANSQRMAQAAAAANVGRVTVSTRNEFRGPVSPQGVAAQAGTGAAPVAAGMMAQQRGQQIQQSQAATPQRYERPQNQAAEQESQRIGAVVVEDAIAAQEAGDYAAARRGFDEAFAMTREPAHLFTAAQSAEAEGDPPAAALRYRTVALLPGVDPATRERAEEALAGVIAEAEAAGTPLPEALTAPLADDRAAFEAAQEPTPQSREVVRAARGRESSGRASSADRAVLRAERQRAQRQRAAQAQIDAALSRLGEEMDPGDFSAIRRGITGQGESQSLNAAVPSPGQGNDVRDRRLFEFMVSTEAGANEYRGLLQRRGTWERSVGRIIDTRRRLGSSIDPRSSEAQAYANEMAELIRTDYRVATTGAAASDQELERLNASMPAPSTYSTNPALWMSRADRVLNQWIARRSAMLDDTDLRMETGFGVVPRSLSNMGDGYVRAVREAAAR
jgi:hypothetical protein